MRPLIIAFFLAAVCLYADQVTYKYDDAGRLILVDYGNGQTIAYTYDNAGNLLSRQVSSPPSSSNKKASSSAKKEKPTPKQKDNHSAR